MGITTGSVLPAGSCCSLSCFGFSVAGTLVGYDLFLESLSVGALSDFVMSVAIPSFSPFGLESGFQMVHKPRPF